MSTEGLGYTFPERDQYVAILRPLVLVLLASEALPPDGLAIVFFSSCRLQSKKLLAPPLRPGTAWNRSARASFLLGPQ